MKENVITFKVDGRTKNLLHKLARDKNQSLSEALGK